jgi:hypothetical protein
MQKAETDLTENMSIINERQIVRWKSEVAAMNWFKSL